MYPVGVIEVVGLILVIWLGVLSFLLWKQWQVIHALFPKAEGSEQSMLGRFQEVLVALEDVTRREESLAKSLKKVSVDGLHHLQRVSLIRYNPYGDTGGEQSFSFCLLDGKGCGILVTSLHTRAGTRVYAKQIVDQKAQLQLSKEEQQVLDQTINS